MQLLTDGFALLVVGMGTVFAFLAAMVVCITLASRIARRWSHLLPELAPAKPAPRAKKPAAAAAAAAAPGDDTDLLAAISAAIHRYRHRR